MKDVDPEKACPVYCLSYDEMPCRQPGRVAPQQRVRLALIDDVKRWDKDLQPA